MKYKNKNQKRLSMPEDTLRKRQISYTGETFHELHQFPGEFKAPCMNEVPTLLNQQMRTDGSYYGEIDGITVIFNPEDKSAKVDEEELLKSYTYNKNLSYAFRGTDVFSSITTPLPLIKCATSIDITQNINYSPNIISYITHFNGEKILNTMTEQIMTYKTVISKVDAMKIVLLPRMFKKDQHIILEKACNLLAYAKIKDAEFKNELILQMQCMIHKYAKTQEDIDKLEEVIGLKAVEETGKYRSNWDLESSYNSGFVEGEISVALKIKEALGIEEAVRISGYSRRQLELYSNSK